MNLDTKHTPGPWHRRIDQREICNADNDVICETWSWMGLLEADANEHLIAAAPDLFIELKTLLGILHPDEKARYPANIRRSLAAIAKAQGLS